MFLLNKNTDLIEKNYKQVPKNQIKGIENRKHFKWQSEKKWNKFETQKKIILLTN
jgi:hypothetical protein